MKNAKRYLAVVLSFALFLALPLAFTQEAAAASKGTKVTQPSKVITTETSTGIDEEGNVYNYNDTFVGAFAYDKKGLNTLYAEQNSKGEFTSNVAFTYNKSGYRTARTELSKKDEPTRQTIYSVKNGRVKAKSNYKIDGAKVDLQNFTKNTYKNGKIAKKEYATADGSCAGVATYKKGVLSKILFTEAGTYEEEDEDGNVKTVKETTQTVILYDKYGNVTSDTTISSNGNTWKTVYKNTYKKGKLVKVASATAWSGSSEVSTGLIVYTYKNGKLVKEVSASTNPWEPGVTYGETTVYAYTKGGLIKTISSARTTTTATETKVDYSETTAFQYQKVAVDKKCVKAVKEAMEDYSYEAYLPVNGLPGWFWQ